MVYSLLITVYTLRFTVYWLLITAYCLPTQMGLYAPPPKFPIFTLDASLLMPQKLEVISQVKLYGLLISVYCLDFGHFQIK